jgi:nicotinamide-nucleotide amidase
MTLYELSQKLGKLLQQRSLMLTTAESCTGGYIAQMITAVPDSSQWFGAVL